MKKKSGIPKDDKPKGRRTLLLSITAALTLAHVIDRQINCPQTKSIETGERYKHMRHSLFSVLKLLLYGIYYTGNAG